MRIDPDVRDHYRVLGVPRDASMHEIHRAYRRLARQHHPDISAHPEDGHYFAALTTAYEVLHDPDKRARYDQARRGPQTPDLERRPRRWTDPDRSSPGATRASFPRRGRDRRAVLELSRREAAHLAVAPLTVRAGEYTIELPAGTRPGQQIRLVGAGERGWLGGPPGDLLLTIEAPNPSLQAARATLLELLFAREAASTYNSSMLFPGGRFTWR